MELTISDELKWRLVEAAGQFVNDHHGVSEGGVDLNDPMVQKQVQEAVAYFLVEVGLFSPLTVDNHMKATVTFPK